MLSKLTLIFSAMLGLVFALLPHILWFIGWLIGKCFHYSLPYAPFGWTALCLVLGAWSLMAYGYLVGRWQMETREVTVCSPTLPAA